MSKGLYWFEHDLRICDNVALQQLATQVDQLHCIYIFDSEDFSTSSHKGSAQFKQRRIGQHRYRFIRQALDDLQQQLLAAGQFFS